MAGRISAGSASETGLTVTEDSEFRYHPVDKRDTLMGLSLKYGITIDAIRRANDLPTDNLSTTKVLRIPLTKSYKVLAPVGSEDSKGALLRKFRVTNGISEVESRAYLEVADWNYDEAQASYNKDMAFEKSHQVDLQKFLDTAAAPSPEKTSFLVDAKEIDAFSLAPSAPPAEEIPLLDSHVPVRASAVQTQPVGGGNVRRRHASDSFSSL